MRHPMKQVNAEKVRSWWDEFRATGSEESRNRLLEHYLPIVKYTAERLHTKLPDEVEVDDLISSGIFGLMDAVRAFDVNRGVKFETYCAQRIRGAILDELRSLDWVPRLVRARAQKLNRATQFLEAQLGRKPNEKELATQMKLPMKEFHKLQRDAKATGVVSLNRKFYETDSNRDVSEQDILEDEGSESPIRVAQRKDLKDLLTRGLSRAERLIIILYYFEEMTMKEIGKTLDLSESRVSQMHSAIMDRLRTQLQRRRVELQTT
jgi:RNA polymerase sigma factor for flagellar operon FliA